MCDALRINWKLNNKSSTPSKASKSSHGGGEKRKLRAASLQKRVETEHKKAMPRKRGPKPRPKSAPMSKYRRKTANMRERQRMGEINNAFERLRDKIPNPVLSGRGKCEKLTKINILHVTINYIRAMENLLATGDSGVRSYSEMVRNPIRPDEKPNKFDHLDFMEDEDDFQSFSSTEKKSKSPQLKNNKKQQPPNNVKKNVKKSKTGVGGANNNNNTTNTNALTPIQPTSSTSTVFTFTPQMLPQFPTQPVAIKTCLETSSDSGISVSSTSPTFSVDNNCPSSMEALDPLLSANNRNNNNFVNAPLEKTFDMNVTDDMLEEVVGLVDSMQDDFPDISFEDPFELFPKQIS